MKIFLVASECVPFIKTGGLADVVGALPAALKKLGAEVSVLIPKYSMIPQQFRKEMQHITDFSIQLGWRKQYVGVEKIHREGIDFYFADNEFYFKQDYVYSSGDFEAERYCWFSKAALEIMQKLDIVPDIIHLNDWQTGMIPLLLREHVRIDRLHMLCLRQRALAKWADQAVILHFYITAITFTHNTLHSSLPRHQFHLLQACGRIPSAHRLPALPS